MKPLRLSLLSLPLLLQAPLQAAQQGPYLLDLKAGPAPEVEGDAEDDTDLTELSLEELMNIEVTVVSKSKQKLSDVPAAVYVLTGDEIRRSGFSSVQEALRMVPGFQVSHWTNSMWDVTVRGYGTGLSLTNSAYLNQLLVMIDGVPVYSPLFAGVWWALQDIELNDVDRIEVIRGPGGIVWGSNTVHGVVNIITKHTEDTQGSLLHTWYGSEDRHYSFRQGIKLGENAYLRAYGKVSTYDSPDNTFFGYRQEWTLNSAGFRVDWGNPEGWHYNMWGRAYRGRFRNIGFDLVMFEPYSSLNDKEGGQFMWKATNGETGSTWSAWYQQDTQNIQTHVDIDIEQIDLEYQREVSLGESSRLNYGLGFRYVDSYVFGDDPFFFDFDPHRQIQQNWRAFLVDTIDFEESRTQLVLGLQLEQNEFTDFEIQPSIRGSWRPSDQTMLWAAISRAVRTPSLEEVSLTDDSLYIGDPDFDSEELLAYELGGRWQPGPMLALDLALFYNDYEELLNGTFDGVFGTQLGNDAEGHAYGGELALDIKPTESWNIRSAYSHLKQDFTELNGSDPISTDEYSAQDLFNLRSYYDVTEDIDFDVGVYMVDGLGQPFDGAEYWRGDARIGWRPSETLELAVGVQNFDDPSHSEFDDFDNIRRQAYFSLTWTPNRRKVD